MAKREIAGNGLQFYIARKPRGGIIRDGGSWPDTAGQGSAHHRRREARRRGDLPAPARRGRGRAACTTAPPALEARALQVELNARRPNSLALAQADLLKVATGVAARQGGAQGSSGGSTRSSTMRRASIPTAIGEITEQAWDDLIGTNLKAPLFLAQAAAPELRKKHGCIVNIIDIHAELPMRNHAVYTAAKGGLARAHARARARSRARGAGERRRARHDPVARRRDMARRGARQRIINQTALKRIGEPDDIAAHGAIPPRRRALHHRPDHRGGRRAQHYL